MICMVLVVLSGKMLYEGEHGVMTVVEISSKELLFQLEDLDKKEEEENDEELEKIANRGKALVR